jgi:apolipoprotein N-acyltransferase
MGVFFFGGIKLMSPEIPREHLKVALVQPGIPQTIIWDANERTNRLNKLLELSHEALAHHPDLLVWPEAALPPGMIGRTRDTQQLITALVRSNQVWMIFGVIDTAGANNEIELNSAFLIDPAGDLISRYNKRKLVVFGEYMPATRWLPFLKKLRADGAGLQAGRVPVHFQMGMAGARISPLICFEDVFPLLTRESVDSETDFLLNLTNNGWFGVGAAQWQHAVSALFRAIENGLPLVRCTNNGLTCWIDSVGRLHDVYFPGSTDIYQAGFKIVEIPLRSLAEKKQGQTIYNRLGDWFSFLCVAVTGSTLAWIFMQEKRRQTGTKLV